MSESSRRRSKLLPVVQTSIFQEQTNFQQRTRHFAAKTVAEKGLYLKGHTVLELIDLFGAPWLKKNLLYVDKEILQLVEQYSSMNDAQLRDFVDNCTGKQQNGR